ncbi:hypothetical protein LPJ78_004769 [Coemansia sp. RSA 989]|nr:hypothetical protein LPJ68_004366 [Coemansia sp. RSA 1086]KAJ1748239.1 hypothetical protein LPJ79_004697 [Coemansia sp. RSA 1821]KAJ1862381.1 hypothetical protein LPJ78_004769 [Coemansia sp. RSA 989]KAJ1870196.1 hypothetical protein LPJ55_004825 [Coemansia sp. RSA 990]KAJ2669013.1 hypothetical protein IWW42_004853 [Coemansia sp. RSA 1085]
MKSKDELYSQRGALPIPSDVSVGDLTQAPENGEQYMLRVRLEAESIPKVVTALGREALLQPANYIAPASQNNPEAHSPGMLQPSKEWLACFTRFFAQERLNFKTLLQNISIPDGFSLPNSGQLREWKQLCYEATSPTTKNMHYTFAAMDQAMALRLIKWLTAWISADKLLKVEGMWMWYLILKLDSLLDPDDMHSLREMCRKLKLVRGSIGHNSDELLKYHADEIAAINILIASVTHGYGQRDLGE